MSRGKVRFLAQIPLHVRLALAFSGILANGIAFLAVLFFQNMVTGELYSTAHQQSRAYLWTDGLQFEVLQQKSSLLTLLADTRAEPQRQRLQKSLAALNQMVTQPPQYESDHFNTLKKTVEQKLGMYQHQLNLFLTLTAAGNKKDAARLMDETRAGHAFRSADC